MPTDDNFMYMSLEEKRHISCVYFEDNISFVCIALLMVGSYY